MSTLVQMLKSITRLVCVSLIPVFILSFSFTKTDDDYIDWHQDQKLTWKDFKGRPEQGTDRAALSFIQIHADFGYKNNTLTWHITCRFNKKKSWGKTKTDYILAHEQLHFDITEAHARILNRRLSAYRYNAKTFQQDLDRIYSSTMKEENQMQRNYDQETNHSINTEKQAEWQEKIKKLLADTQKYAGYN